MIVKRKTRSSGSRSSWGWLVLALALVAVVVSQAGSASKALASSATLSLSPTSGTYQVGNTITVDVYENSGSDDAVAVQADFTYPQSVLTYTGMDTSNSAFGVAAPSSGGNGSVDIDLGSYLPVTNNVLVATVTFDVIAPGTAALNFSPTCTTTSTSDCVAVYDNSVSSNLVTATTGANYTLQNPTATTTPPTTPPATPPTPVTYTPPPATTTPPSSGSGSAPSTPVKVYPKYPRPSDFSSTTYQNSYIPTTKTGNIAPVSTPNNSQVSASQPVTVEPSTVQTQGVRQVDYYLNKKLVYVATTPPYAYQLNTKKLLDGKYSLTSDTLYDTGKISSSSQQVFVTNPLSAAQIWLFVKHYLVVPIIVILAVLIVWQVVSRLKNRVRFNGGGSKGGGSSGGRLRRFPYAKQPEAPVIRPNASVLATEEADETPETE